MTCILSLWDAIVESAAVIALVAIAVTIMLGIIDTRHELCRIGVMLGALVLLLPLSLILVALWRSLSDLQQLAVITFAGLLVLVAVRASTLPTGKR